MAAKQPDRPPPSGAFDAEDMAELRDKSAGDEWTSDSKNCPKCGLPVENLRFTCPHCGREYSERDYDQDAAGMEFVSGSNITEEGEEITDRGPGVEEGAE